MDYATAIRAVLGSSGVSPARQFMANDEPITTRRWSGAVLPLAAVFLFLIGLVRADEGQGGELKIMQPATVGGTPVSKQPVFGSAAWVKVTDAAAFSPRDTAEDAVFDGRMWLSNGYYHGNVLYRDLWASTDGLTWAKILDNTPYDGYSEMAVFDGKLWAVKSSVWCTEGGVVWRQVLDKTPFGERGYGELVVHDGKMWQLGSGADVWNTADGIHWTCVCNEAPYGDRAASAVVVHDGKLWLMGGRLRGENTPPDKGYKQYTTFNDIWCSADGANWARVVEHAPWSPRMWFIAKEYAGEIWIVGGYDNANAANLGDVWHSADGQDWKAFAPETTFSPRHEPTLYVYDHSLWVVAGNSWPVKNDVWRLTLPGAQ